MKNNLPATKADLEKFITKKEFKTEVAKLATKKELKSEIAKINTKLEQTESILRAEIRFTADEVKEEIREEIKQSESRIINVLDSFLGEMKTSQEERAITAHQISDHEDRISVLTSPIR